MRGFYLNREEVVRWGTTRILRRVLAGRKRVSVSRWKWDFPQTLTTLQRVPQPPQRLLPGRRLERAALRFSDFLRMLDERDQDHYGG
jgi:hypothetical protein